MGVSARRGWDILSRRLTDWRRGWSGRQRRFPPHRQSTRRAVNPLGISVRTEEPLSRPERNQMRGLNPRLTFTRVPSTDVPLPMADGRGRCLELEDWRGNAIGVPGRKYAGLIIAIMC